MGWAELEEECFHTCHERWQNIQEADILRTTSEPGNSADESSGTPLSQGTEQPWWVAEVLKHTRSYRFQDPRATSIRLLSGCTGMAAEAFALQDNLL